MAEWRAQAEAIRARYGAIRAAEPVPARLGLAEIDQQSRAGRPWRTIAAVAAAAFLLGGAAGWFAHGVTGAAPSSFDLTTADALEAYKLYVVEVRHPVEVPGAERQHLTEWLSKRLDTDVHAPDLRSMRPHAGRRPTHSRTGGGGHGPVHVRSPVGRPLHAILHAFEIAPDRHALSGDRPRRIFYWVDRGLAYVVSGPSDRTWLSAVAKSAYDQIDSAARPAGG